MTQRKKIALIGGGQLSLLLAEAKKDLPFDLLVVSSQLDEPVRHLEDSKDVYFFRNLDELKTQNPDFICIENEFVSVEQLRAFQKDSPKTQFVPSLDCIEQLQNKHSQKLVFKKHKLPTSPFIKIRPNMDEDGLDSLLEDYPNGLALKWAQNGYDGKGVFILEKSHQIADALDFLKLGFSKSDEIYAEEKIDFKAELALVVSHTTQGALNFYPLVESKQLKGICSMVRGPAVELGYPDRLETEAKEIAKTLATKLKLYGTFAIEFFLTKKNELIINEIAPRVHNSGHYTTTAFSLSQFEAHWLSVLGSFEKSNSEVKFFAMLNLIGPDEIVIKSYDLEDLLPKIPKNSELKWYFKNEVRPGRKMGHLNTTANSPEELAENLSQLKIFEMQWKANLEDAFQAKQRKNK